MDQDHYDQLLSRQLLMNPQTWETLKKHGVNEQTALRLDFSYNAPSQEAAELLRAFLYEETDYDVRVESNAPLGQRDWRVEGSTQTTTVSPQILDQWVTWMVIAGKEKGGCDFDGWGTSI